MNLADVSYDELESFWADLEPSLRPLDSLEVVAQQFTEALYRAFERSIVLVRVFATSELQELPAFDRTFVDALALSTDARARLTETTDVLSLLGTAGVEPVWNDRRASTGHLGIPLISEAYIETIPMISRLLTDVGFRPAWSVKRSDYVSMSLANVNGLFSSRTHARRATTAIG